MLEYLTSNDRPTNKRILDLEERNRQLFQSSVQLREQLISKRGNQGSLMQSSNTSDNLYANSNASLNGASSPAGVVHSTSPHLMTPSEGCESIPAIFPSPQAVSSEKSELRFHGPTSAMFEQASSVRDSTESTGAVQLIPVELMKSLLVAQAAKESRLHTPSLTLSLC